MIDRDRLIRLFTELVSIDSPSRGEREAILLFDQETELTDEKTIEYFI